MSKYKCDRCDKFFDKKYNYEIHINRRYKCDEKLYTLNCTYCDRSFSTKSSVTRHIRNSCKVFKKTEEDKHEIYTKLLKIERENKELKEEVKELKNGLLKQKGGNLDNVTKITNNTTNNNCSINNGIINNNITIIAYGKEKLSKIDVKQILAAVSRGYQTPVHLTKTVHFNPKHPEYHNVYIPSMKDSYAMIYNGEDWNLVQKNELIDELYQDKKEYVEENLDEFSKSLSKSKLNALKRWIDSDDGGDKCIKKIKKDIELLLYNQRKIPIKTKKLNSQCKKKSNFYKCNDL